MTADVKAQWQAHENCAEYELSENGEMQRLTGSIEIRANNEMFFNEQKTGKTYKLIPCDINCVNNLNKWI